MNENDIEKLLTGAGYTRASVLVGEWTRTFKAGNGAHICVSIRPGWPASWEISLLQRGKTIGTVEAVDQINEILDQFPVAYRAKKSKKKKR